jgi:hypothetical protein
MGLYEQWKELAGKERSKYEYDTFWSGYFEKEKNNYSRILGDNMREITGKLGEVARSYDMDSVTFTGFLDGINTSLNEQLPLEELAEETEIKLDINFEKLYYNMLDAKADWLYNLPEWEDILSVDTRKEIRKEYNTSKIAVSSKVGRNDPCPCGSGKKYKKCCGM